MRTILCQSGLVVLVLLCPAAHAAERITLSNGFSVDCSRHEMVNGRVRLYTSGDNYMDIAADRIVHIEAVADPVVQPVPAASARDAVKPVPNTAAQDETLTREELQPLLLHAGTEHRIDGDLLYSVIKAESAGHVTAVSRAGAQGLMQLMPATSADLGVSNAFVPAQNVNGGAAYLDQLLMHYHDDVTLALAAYNAGPQAVDRYHGVPPYAETRAYVRRVILEFNRRKLAAKALTSAR